MKLEDLGYPNELEEYRREKQLEHFAVARVIAEHKERYMVQTADGEYEAEILGNLRFAAQSRADFPAVGDWVAIALYGDDKALIHAVFPRKSVLERQAVGKTGEKQIIAANIDYALIVQAVDRDFSINRLERYLTICHTAKVQPIIILNKIDLADEATVDKLLELVRKRIRGVPLLAVSNESGQGIASLQEYIRKGCTYCLLGSSGVGKSTLLNSLQGTQLMKTDDISAHSDRGRHVTTRRELRILANGGILIDNPGMREVGIADSEAGIGITFETIAELAQACKFKDCSHTAEAGCAVVAAVEAGELDRAAYENYCKMEREKARFESTLAEKRKKDKDFGKMIRNYKKGKDQQ
ncbi:ribosome small subunit-dependent GTPase A [Mangrovibacterium marinum]|uniref:Small ribosomal subunit biogenesis GTPase RsgA n=1 Tax=Mangrovibacterium marinum TaxID=1639118 RepID=A0A2T5C1P7_9BACT|nr:ribosome small subunit-dependent GTPase A [Mangrovibacterium marinum]PTN08577.1 ribosome biogenesis GTPase [Mangrovibacterium marinum]